MCAGAPFPPIVVVCASDSEKSLSRPRRFRRVNLPRLAHPPPGCAMPLKFLNGKIVLQVYLLDNSTRTLLIEPTTTVHVRRLPSSATLSSQSARAPAAGAPSAPRAACDPPPPHQPWGVRERASVAPTDSTVRAPWTAGRGCARVELGRCRARGSRARSRAPRRVQGPGPPRPPRPSRMSSSFPAGPARGWARAASRPAGRAVMRWPGRFAPKPLSRALRRASPHPRAPRSPAHRLLLLRAAHAPSQDASEMMARKIGFADPEEDCLCFSMHECRDGVTSTRSTSLSSPFTYPCLSLPPSPPVTSRERFGGYSTLVLLRTPITPSVPSLPLPLPLALPRSSSLALVLQSSARCRRTSPSSRCSSRGTTRGSSRPSSSSSASCTRSRSSRARTPRSCT